MKFSNKYKTILNEFENNRTPKNLYWLTKENIRRNTKDIRRLLLKGNKPGFIIIGAQKAGTSSLHYYLNQHPKLIGSIPKEIHYFDRWVYNGNDIQWYEKYFNSFFPKNKIFFESTPSYIYYENVAKQLSTIYPDIKLILLLRDPVFRAFSAWKMYQNIFIQNKDFFINKEWFPGFENLYHKYFYFDNKKFPGFMEAIQLECNIVEKNGDKEPSILRRGNYARQIKSYYKYFEKNQILIIGFKDLINNTESTLKKIYRFLDIKEVPISEINIMQKNKNKYDEKLSSYETNFLERYYLDSNYELWNILGEEINW